jgi:sugar-specific transcriptional regulator TrmB
MDYKITENLRKLGLQENEAKIHSALLKLRKGTVATISQSAELNRTTGYDVLERLALYDMALPATRVAIQKQNIMRLNRRGV